MQAEALYDYIKSLVVKTRCGLASYWCNKVIVFEQHLLEIEILLSKTVDTYDNLHLLQEIKNTIDLFNKDGNYKITTLDTQQYIEHVTVKIIFRPLQGELTKVHKQTNFLYQT